MPDDIDKSREREEKDQLAKRGDILDRFEVWVKTLEIKRLIGVSVVASGLTALGWIQDFLAPILAMADAWGGSVDEMLVGAPPEVLILEIIRRMTGWWYGTTGWDGLAKLRVVISRMPTWALVVGFVLIDRILMTGDIAIYIPVVGQTVVWPGQFLDQFIFGLPALLIALEGRNRLGDIAPKHISGPTSSGK